MAVAHHIVRVGGNPRVGLVVENHQHVVGAVIREHRVEIELDPAVVAELHVAGEDLSERDVIRRGRQNPTVVQSQVGRYVGQVDIH